MKGLTQRPFLFAAASLCLLAWGCKEPASTPEQGSAGDALNPDFSVPFQMIEVPSGRYRLQVRTFGDDSAPALLLVHGFQRSGATFVPLVAALAGTHRLIVPDLPGHGLTTRKRQGGPPPTFDEFEAALLAVADQLGLDRFDLLGHSMGGLVAAGVAADYPERVRRLILLEATPTYGWPKSVACAGPCGERLDFERAVPDANRQVHGAEQYAAIWSAYVAEDNTRVFAIDHLPILWLMNTDDTYGPEYFLNHARKVDPAAPGRIRLVTMRERGHFLHWTEPQRVSEAIVAFLSETGEGGT